ncbi:hypothetical protein M2454_000192 [Aequitasia blattaphilus]
MTKKRPFATYLLHYSNEKGIIQESLLAGVQVNEEVNLNAHKITSKNALYYS